MVGLETGRKAAHHSGDGRQRKAWRGRAVAGDEHDPRIQPIVFTGLLQGDEIAAAAGQQHGDAVHGGQPMLTRGPDS